MDLSPKDIGRIIGAVVLVAIMVYLFYDRKKTLSHKLNGRERRDVLPEQISMMKSQVEAMRAVMGTYLDMFRNEAACSPRELYKALSSVYNQMDAAAEAGDFIDELFDEDTLKLAGNCQSIFNDFGFQSNFYDIMGLFSEQFAPPFVSNAVKSAYRAFTHELEPDVKLQFTPEKFAKLEKLMTVFEKAREKLLARLEKKYGC